MTNAPSNGPDPESEPQKRERKGCRRRFWRRSALAMGAIALVGVAGGAWFAWVFVNQRLSPWASRLLADSLSRPVDLGAVEGVSLTGIRFGPSAIPPTADDPDKLYVEAIAIRFNPLQLLRRRISPRIILNDVQASFEQTADGQWIETELDLPEPPEDPLITVNPVIDVRNSEVLLLPYRDGTAPSQALTIENINGVVGLFQTEAASPNDPNTRIDARRIRLTDFTATFKDAGRIEARGEILQYILAEPPDSPLDSLEGTLALQVQALDLAALSPVVLGSLPQSLPLSVAAGELNGNLEVELIPQAMPRVTGTAELSDGSVQFEALPQPVADISAQARFQGRRLALEDVTANYGSLSATAGGLIDLQDGYDLSGEVAPFELATLTEELGLALPIAASGTFRAEATVTGALQQPKVTGRLRSVDTATFDQVQVASLEAAIAYTHPDVTLETLRVEPLAGGEFTGSGRYSLAPDGALALTLTGRGLPADAIGRAYGLPETITLGIVAVDATVSGPLDELQGEISWRAPAGTYPTRGVVTLADGVLRLQESQVQIAGGTVSATGTLVDRQWEASLSAQGVQLGQFRETLRGSTAGGNAQLAGSLDDLTLTGIRGSGDLSAAIAGGTLNGQFSLTNGAWQAQVQGRGLQVQPYLTTAVPVGAVSTDAQLSGRVDDLTLAGIDARGTLSTAIARGTLTSQFSLANGVWQADGRGRDIQLGQLSPELRGTATGDFQLSGDLSDLSPEGIRGRTTVTLSAGLATPTRLATQIDGSRQPLTATLAWDGQQIAVEQAATEGLSAQGTVTPQLSGPGAPGIAALDLFLNAQDYVLANLPVPLPQLVDLEGLANFSGRLTGSLDDLRLAGNLALDDLAVNELTFEPLSGGVRFASGDGLSVDLQGTEQDQITVNYRLPSRQLDFRIEADEALATGATEGDRLQAQVYNFPLSVLSLPPPEIRQYGILRGRVSFASATVNLQDFSTVGQVDVRDIGIGYISVDRVFGGFTYANGIAALNNGQIRMQDVDSAGEVTATRRYDISGRYGLNADPQLQATLATEAGDIRDILTVLKIVELTDIVRSLRPPEALIPDSQEAAEALLATAPAGSPDGRLLDQLRRLSEIQALEVIEERESEEGPLPPLSELEGRFAGRVQVSASLPDDIAVGFNIDGQNWRWSDEYGADTVVAKGRFQDGLLQLAPVSLTSDVGESTAQVSLSGALSLDPQRAANRPLELSLANIPVENLQEPLNIPFPIGGRLNGNATFQGRITDPRMAGSFDLAAGTINEKPIDRADLDFSYAGARLSLDSELLLVDSDDPLTLKVKAPYQLPFVAEPPTSDELLVEVDIRDEGIALVNLFTDQVAWRSGQGRVRLNLKGTWEQQQSIPDFASFETFDGSITVSDAEIGVRVLPEPLTNVNGSARLVPFEVIVEQLTGQFSDGQLSAQGTFPILEPLPSDANGDAASNAGATAPQDASSGSAAPPVADTNPDTVPESAAPPARTPLALSLRDIDLNLKGLYNGSVDGALLMRGSLLFFGPQLTGEITLSNGRISIPESPTEATATASAVGRQGFFSPAQFSDLRITLGNGIRIIQGNILNVASRGSLVLNGTPPVDLRPSGVVRLTTGRVNLFTTTLRLAGGDNRAEFRGSFDPILDLTLVASVPEVSGSEALITSSPFPRNEVPDPAVDSFSFNQGGTETIRVEAEVNGPASKLNEPGTVSLSSSPPRSEAEIVSLLSGGVLTALQSTAGSVTGEGDSFQGLVNIAGSALLNTLQNVIGDRLPVSELRLFPASPESAQVNDTQDIGAEVGFDISPTISFSVLKVLTSDTPFQFNTRYRLSDQFTVRGTTSFEDFSDRTGVLLEYETRF